MNATILNYPGFQTLPKGVKQMLLVSESYFFEQDAAPRPIQNRAVYVLRAIRGFKALPQRVADCAAESALSVRRIRIDGLRRPLRNGWAA
jgi:hypothetical protein